MVASKIKLYLNVLLLQGSNYYCYCPTHRSPLLLPCAQLPHALLPHTLLPHMLLPRTPPPPLHWPARYRHCAGPHAAATALAHLPPLPPPPLLAPVPVLLPCAAAVGHPSCQLVSDHPSSSAIICQPSVADCHG